MSDDLKDDGYRETLAKRLNLSIEARSDGALFDALAKLPALFEHYAIDVNDPTRWIQLALALALKHVPGFQLDLPASDTQRPRGRPALSLQARKRRLDLYRECVVRRVLDPSLSWDSAAEEAIAALGAKRGFDAHDTGDAGREARRGRDDVLHIRGISKEEWKSAVPPRRPEAPLSELLLLLTEEQADTLMKSRLAALITKLELLAQRDEFQALSDDDLKFIHRVLTNCARERE